MSVVQPYGAGATPGFLGIVRFFICTVFGAVSGPSSSWKRTGGPCAKRSSATRQPSLPSPWGEQSDLQAATAPARLSLTSLDKSWYRRAMVRAGDTLPDD